jgi:hypothetical protein
MSQKANNYNTDRNDYLHVLSFSHIMLLVGSIRYLIRELKINSYYDTTAYVNGEKIALVLV